ncbi:hypothetical protein [uncultured Psychroserpens sp.]|uniref:hypothetical protein n=1 Tax=uncultured Psychroserpens sp. TaxID=255436 RepID=UPI002618D777|nr:hypothetical protein [uncultured Psychroserpens sp.]
MENDFKLSEDQPISKACHDQGLTHYADVFNYVKALPYGRTSNRGDFRLVLQEHKGTCSTKHALLKAIALENSYTALELYLGIFKMNAVNTPKIRPVLEYYELEYIPEAHCYLKHNNTITDLTFSTNNSTSFLDDLLHEETIIPDQIGDYKVRMHQSYIKFWIEDNKLRYNFEQLWNIREICIKTFSE